MTKGKLLPRSNHTHAVVVKDNTTAVEFWAIDDDMAAKIARAYVKSLVAATKACPNPIVRKDCRLVQLSKRG
jgi:hypothetical protein